MKSGETTEVKLILKLPGSFILSDVSVSPNFHLEDDCQTMPSAFCRRHDMMDFCNLIHNSSTHLAFLAIFLHHSMLPTTKTIFRPINFGSTAGLTAPVRVFPRCKRALHPGVLPPAPPSLLFDGRRGMKRSSKVKARPKLPDYCDVEPRHDEAGNAIWPAPAAAMEEARAFIREWYMGPRTPSSTNHLF